MAQSSVGTPCNRLALYPHLWNSYNDQLSSDITLCFAENEEDYSHEIILRAVSGVWNQAFQSKLPISTQDKYYIQGHSSIAIHSVMRCIYGTALWTRPDGITDKGQLDYLFDVFNLANEYEIRSLGQAVTERVVQLMETYRIRPGYIDVSHLRDYTGVDEGIKEYGVVISKTAELYINNDVGDRSLMNGVLDACFAQCDSIKWMEENLHLSSLVKSWIPG
jgi:hypothetical protein